MGRIGIFGGTFDPPHIGHLVLADCAVQTLALDKLLFVPAAAPPHKPRGARQPIDHRLAMLEHVLPLDPCYAISRVDIDRPGPHYSVDMVRLIQSAYPGAELFFLMGGDSLRDLPTWYQPQQLIQQCKLAVMRRADASIELSSLEALIPGITQQVVVIDAPLIEVSSTEIVQRLRDGKSVRYIVPQPVLEYISEQQLYQD